MQRSIIPQKHESKWFYIFQKEGYFSLSFFFFFLSAAAACSQGLVASVWWCNAVTVLLQSSRKASATAFRTTPASNKDTYTARRWSGHHRLSGLTERRQAEAKGGERKCHVLVMKYRTVAGLRPKPICLHVSRGVCEESVSEYACEGSCIWMCRQRAVCVYVCMYVLCLQLSQMCPFPESFLRAISSAEEFSPLPIASSTAGGPIILIPYRDGEVERW